MHMAPQGKPDQAENAGSATHVPRTEKVHCALMRTQRLDLHPHTEAGGRERLQTGLEPNVLRGLRCQPHFQSLGQFSRKPETKSSYLTAETETKPLVLRQVPGQCRWHRKSRNIDLGLPLMEEKGIHTPIPPSLTEPPSLRGSWSRQRWEWGRHFHGADLVGT